MALLVLALSGVGCEPAAPVRYRLVRLAVPDGEGPRSSAGAINESGQVAGVLDDPANERDRLVLWTDGEPAVLGGDGFLAGTNVRLNERGDVVHLGTPTIWRDGIPTTITTPTPTVVRDLDNRGRVLLDGTDRAYIWDDGELRELDGLVAPSGTELELREMNDRGQVIGQIREDTRPWYPVSGFVWEDGQTTVLGSLGGDPIGTNPVAINARGQVAGLSFTAAGREHVFLWEDGVMTDLGIPGYEVTAISDAGHVVGLRRTEDWLLRGFIWHEGVTTDLGSLGNDGTTFDLASARPYAVNDRGQVVGLSYTATGVQHAFVWSRGVMTDLDGGPEATTVRGYAVDINDRGRIAGFQIRGEPGAETMNAVVWAPRRRPRTSPAPG